MEIYIYIYICVLCIDIDNYPKIKNLMFLRYLKYFSNSGIFLGIENKIYIYIRRNQLRLSSAI